jgi:hypothetical protein
MTLNQILYSTIKTWEIEERIRREDAAFDAYEFLSKKIGHKNSSTLRKMCGPESSRSGAKLGVEDAMIIMYTTTDYRLLAFIKEELKKLQIPDSQMNLFSQPHREL